MDIYVPLPQNEQDQISLSISKFQFERIKLDICRYIDPKESIFGKVREKDERIRKQKDNLIDESKEDGKKITEETEEEQKHVQYHKQSYSEQFKNANLISIKDLRNSLISGFELATCTCLF
jgi:hypothetical protein